MSLQGCPREVRLLLAGPYYYDVDMVNSLPNVARQLAGLGMESAPNLQALHALCDGRDAVLGDIEAHYGLTGSPALGETARGVANTTSPQPLGQALVLQFTLAQALVVPWWDLALAQGSPKAWHALVVPWLTEIHQG